MAKVYAKKRDANERKIIDALQGVGATVIQADHPDLIVGFRGVNYLIEVKDKGGRLRPVQQEMLKGWEGQYAVCYTIDEALEAIGAI